MFIKWKEKKKNNVILWSIMEFTSISLSATFGYLYFYNIGVFGNVDWMRFTLVYVIPNVFLIFSFAVNKGIISKVMSNKLCIYIGNISAYIFFHQLIVRIMNKMVFHHIATRFDITPFRKFVIVIVISILMVNLYQFSVRMYRNISRGDRKCI